MVTVAIAVGGKTWTSEVYVYKQHDMTTLKYLQDTHTTMNLIFTSTAQGAICWSKVESSESLRLMYKCQDHSAWESN